MGGSQSIDETVLGRSLIGRTFQTTGSTYFSYCAYDGTYALTGSKSLLGNPKQPAFELEIKTPIQFKIIGATKRWGIDSGTSVSVRILFLNPLPTDMIGSIREAEPGFNWVKRQSLAAVQSPMLPFCIDNHLEISGLTGIIYTFEFGFRFPSDYNVEVPCDIDTTFLQEIDSGSNSC